MRPHSTSPAFAALACLLGVAAVCCAGCASDSDGAKFVGPNLGSPQTAKITADWDDVDAAVEVGVPRAEMAVEFSDTPAPDERVFYLRTITAETAKLTIRRTTDATEPAEIALEARAGMFGNPAQEKKLLAAVCARLEDLKGVAYAPVRGP